MSKKAANTTQAPTDRALHRYRADWARKIECPLKLRTFYDDYKDNVHSDVIQAMIENFGELSLSDGIALYEYIDWNSPLNDTSTIRFGTSLNALSTKDLLPCTKSTKCFKNFDPKIDLKHHSANNYWATYSNLHMNRERHHTEFWTNQYKMMPFNDTIELLIDHVVSAMRLKKSFEEAFHMSMSWLYHLGVSPTSGKNYIIMNEKFRCLDRYAVMYFVMFVAKHGFYEHVTSTLFSTSRRIRSIVYSKEEFGDLIKIVDGALVSGNKDEVLLKTDFDRGQVARELRTKYLEHVVHESAFKNMLNESRQHIRAVEQLMTEFFPQKRQHDRSKMHFFMIASLALKFLKFEHLDKSTEQIADTYNFGLTEFVFHDKQQALQECFATSLYMCLPNEDEPTCTKKYHEKIVKGWCNAMSWDYTVPLHMYLKNVRYKIENHRLISNGANIDRIYRLIGSADLDSGLHMDFADSVIRQWGIPTWLANVTMAPYMENMPSSYIDISNTLNALCLKESFMDCYKTSYDYTITPAIIEPSRLPVRKTYYDSELRRVVRNLKHFLSKNSFTRTRERFFEKVIQQLELRIRFKYVDIRTYTALTGFHPYAFLYDTETSFPQSEIRRLQDEQSQLDFEQENVVEPRRLQECASFPEHNWKEYVYSTKGVVVNDILAEHLKEIHEMLDGRNKDPPPDTTKSEADLIIYHSELARLYLREMSRNFIPSSIFTVFGEHALSFSEHQFKENLASLEDLPYYSIADSASKASSTFSKFSQYVTGVDIKGTNEEMMSMVCDVRAGLAEMREIQRQISKPLVNSMYSVERGVTKLEDAVDAVPIESFVTQLKSLLGDTVDLVGVMNSFFKKLSLFIPDFVKPFGFTLDSILDLNFSDLSACVILYLFWKNTVGDLRHAYLIALLYKFGILHQVVNGCYWVLQNFGLLEESSDIKQEQFSVTDPIMAVLDFISKHRMYAIATIACTLIVGTVGYSHLHSAGIKNVAAFKTKVVDSAKDLNFLGSGFRGLGSMFGYILTGTTVACKWISETVFQKEFKTYEEIQMHEIQYWTLSTHILSTDLGYALMRQNASYREYGKSLHQQGLKIHKLMLEGKYPRSLTQAINTGLSNAKKIYNTCLSFEKATMSRRTPRVVVFASEESNIGKSHIMNDFVNKVYDRYFPGESKSPFSITLKQCEGDDWDGFYDTTRVCTIDDLHSLKEPRQAALLINTVSPAPFTVPCARLEDKGAQFKSEFIIATTNSLQPTYDDLRTPQALYNRLHYTIRTEANKAKYPKAFSAQGVFIPSAFIAHYPEVDIKDYDHLLFTWVVANDPKNQSFPPNKRTITSSSGSESEIKIVKATYKELCESLFTMMDDDRKCDDAIVLDQAACDKSFLQWYGEALTIKQDLEENTNLRTTLFDNMPVYTATTFERNIDPDLLKQASDAAKFVTPDRLIEFLSRDVIETIHSDYDSFRTRSRCNLEFKPYIADKEYDVYKIDEAFVTELCGTSEIPLMSDCITHLI